MFIPIDGFKALLVAKLNVTDTVLPISAPDSTVLCAALGATGHTYLTMANAGQIETVKATCASGVINIVRAQNGTTAITVPAKACIGFQWVKQAISDFIASGAGVAGICDVTTATTDWLQIIPDPANSCAKQINFKKPCTGGARWRFGNTWYEQDDKGCIKTEAAIDCFLQDATYENATVVVKDGRICSVKSGTNIVHSGGGSGCSGCSGDCGNSICAMQAYSGPKTAATLANATVALCIDGATKTITIQELFDAMA